MLSAVMKEMKRNNYKVFNYQHPRDYNLNIVGIRSKNQTVNEFNDYIGAFYETEDGKWRSKFWKATTDPGTYYLLNPMNVTGTAVLVPNQYRSSFKVGYHQGRYKALVQCKSVDVYRDNNRDSNLDFDRSSIERGMFGINIHRASTNTKRVDKWSAGCQVFANLKDFNEFMQLVEASSRVWGSRFTYTLLDGKEMGI